MKTANDAIARRWFEEVWNQRRVETIRELLTPESFCHSEGGMLKGHDPFVDLVHSPFLTAFPDIRLSVEDTVSEGDRVVIRWRAEGTHAGAGLGLEPTHRRVSFHGMTWMRFSNGKILEGMDC
jgi:steroid delta-isomerase-like uncharacterized protein